MDPSVRQGFLAAAIMALAVCNAPAHAHEQEHVNAVFQQAIPNIPGKSLVAIVVSYPPGGKSSPHWHSKSAFIYAHVLAGSIRSQVGDEPAKVYRVGEGFRELPGSHHRVSENASDREPASMLAVIIVDSGDNPGALADPNRGPWQ